MLNLKFNLKDKVQITELERPGRVLAIYVSDTGIQYQVRYFDNEEAKTVYFYEDELEHAKVSALPS